MPRDQTLERQSALLKSSWALDSDALRLHFDEEALNSRRFLEELIKFSRLESQFDTALPLIEAAQQQRKAGAVPRVGIPIGREWATSDILDAMAFHEASRHPPVLRDLSTNARKGPGKRRREFEVHRVWGSMTSRLPTLTSCQGGR